MPPWLPVHSTTASKCPGPQTLSRSSPSSLPINRVSHAPQRPAFLRLEGLRSAHTNCAMGYPRSIWVMSSPIKPVPMSLTFIPGLISIYCPALTMEATGSTTQQAKSSMVSGSLRYISRPDQLSRPLSHVPASCTVVASLEGYVSAHLATCGPPRAWGSWDRMGRLGEKETSWCYGAAYRAGLDFASLGSPSGG